MKTGDIVDRKYELLRLIGKGGCGKVFEARHAVTGRRLALKCLHRDLESQPTTIARFLQEAQSATAIGSQHIVEITDAATAGEDGAPPYVVMEFLEGQDLGSIVAREGPILPKRAVSLVIQAAEALSAAHRAGIIHRDIKPQNLFVTRAEDGREWLKILDFGVAKFKDMDMTKPGVVLGTLTYMAPEAFDGSSLAEPTTDVYALGVVLYELLTGRLPYEAVSLRQLLRMIANTTPARPKEMRGAIGDELDAVVMRALEKDRASRFASMDEMAAALHAALASLSEGGPDEQEPSPPVEFVAVERRDLPLTFEQPPESSGRTSKGISAKVLILILLGALLITGSVVAGLALMMHERASRVPPSPERASLSEVVPQLPPAPRAPVPAKATKAPLVTPTKAPVTVRDDEPAAASRTGPVQPWVRLEPGSYSMGSVSTEIGRGTDEHQHSVTITRPFLMKATEVTQAEWQSLMNHNPSHYHACGSECPVDSVSWFDALAYCNALSRSEGLEQCYQLSGCSGTAGRGFTCAGTNLSRGLECQGYRLPTEAEWEYAARAGTTTATYNGDLGPDSPTVDPFTALDPIAWFGGNSRTSPHVVASKRANAWGLHDMLGNVWEWVWDWYGEYPLRTVTDPVTTQRGYHRSVRGGGWGTLRMCRSASRNSLFPSKSNRFTGFRVARTIAR